MIRKSRKFAAGLSLFFAMSVAPWAHSDTVIVSVAELDVAIAQLSDNPDAIERMVLERINDSLTEADLQLSEGELVFSQTSENLIEDNSCTRTEVRRMTTTAALASNTSLSFTFSSLNDPVEIDVSIVADVAALGRAKQTIGFRLGRCQELAEDNFTFSANGQVDLSLRLTLVLNPVLESGLQRLVLRPVISFNGTLVTRNVRVDVDDSLIKVALERILENEIDDALTTSELVNALDRLNTSLSDRLAEELDEGLLVVDLPTPTDEQVSRLYTLLSPDGDFSLSLGYLRIKRIELLAALLTGDDEQLRHLVSTAAQCQAAGILKTSLQAAPVYQLSDEGCARVTDNQLNNDSFVGMLHSDPQCQTQFDFLPGDTSAYCAYVLDTERLGNAAASTDTLDRWTLSPGTGFDIGALSLNGLEQPYTQRVAYKQIDTDQGQCSLEMRIHTVMPDAIDLEQPVGDDTITMAPAQSLRPLIAFHGGSWQRRSSGALGIEAVATQFANEGFVVFAPFYRLIGSEEGNAACNDATLSDVLADAHDALDWVQTNAARYGAQGKPVLFGQSAGGHMSAVLAVERPDEIASAALFYAPTDFTEFAEQILSGQIDSQTGQDILETVVGQTLDTLDLNAAIIRRNTLTTRIVEDGIITPPLFLLHGMNDTVLPFNQSVRLCDALTGNPDAGPAADALISSADDPLKRVMSCGFDGSELHLITEGEHALDLCIAEELCLAGSPDSAQKTAESVQRMLDWFGEMDARQIELAALNDGGNAGGQVVTTSGGALAGKALLLLLLMACGRYGSGIFTRQATNNKQPWLSLLGCSKDRTLE